MIQPNEFKNEMTKLISVYPQTYTSPKLEIIYDIIKDLNSLWLEKTIRHFIIHFTKAPVPADFHEMAVIERKSNNKLPDSMIATRRENSVFSEEEIQEIFGLLKKISKGHLSRKEAIQYADSVARALESKGVKPKMWKRQNMQGDWIG